MKTGGALLIIAVGILALWIVVTGRLTQLQNAWGVLNGSQSVAPPGGASATSGTSSGLNALLNSLGSLPGLSGPPTIPASYGAATLPAPNVTV